MMITTASGRIAAIRQAEKTDANGWVLKFTMFARPLGGVDDVAVLCTMQGGNLEGIIDGLDTDCFVTVFGGITPKTFPNGKPYLQMTVSKLELQGFAVEEEMAKASP